MSCQFDNWFAVFDSALAFNDHLITVHGANPSPVTPGPVTQSSAPVVKESDNRSPRLTSDINKSAVESKREVPKSLNNNSLIFKRVKTVYEQKFAFSPVVFVYTRHFRIDFCCFLIF